MSESGTLVKFGTHEHVLQLQQTGLLYMNNLPYFWEIEDKELRGDKNDGVDKILRGLKGTVKGDDGIEHQINDWTIRLFSRDLATKTNIFWMYALRLDAGTFSVDTRNFRFGDYALVMTNPQQFMDKVASNLESQGIASFRADLVEYVDDEYMGEVGPFKKLRRFAYQSEWRLVCYDGPGGPRKVQIGSLEDISVMMPSAEVNHKISMGEMGTLKCA